MSEQEVTQRRVISIARRIEAVQRSLSAFDHNGQQYLPKSVAQAILETEYAFAHKDYDRAEHMAKVTAFLVSHEAPRMRANPKAWISRWKDLHSAPTRPTRPVKSEPVVMQRVET
jgi:hypothetical protein